jgi:hypothetical protein
MIVKYADTTLRMAINSNGPDKRSHGFLQGYSGVVGVGHKGIISDIINHFLLGRVELNVVTATRGRLDGCIPSIISSSISSSLTCNSMTFSSPSLILGSSPRTRPLSKPFVMV